MKIPRIRIAKIIGVFGGISLLSGLLYSQAIAQDQQGLSISPVVFEINSDPGDTLTNQLKIYNPTEYAQNVKMKVEDFTPIGEEGQVALEEPSDENATYSLAKWTTVSPSEFILASKEQKIVTFAITVPQNGEPGGHYGSIVAQLSGPAEQAGGSGVTSKRGALILLRVSGNIREEVLIKSFESTKKFQEYGPVQLDLRFENTGNVHLKPAGFIIITDIFGKQVAQIEIPQNNVIPAAVRRAETTWEEKNLVGYYTASVVATYGNTSKETITAVTTFTVFPWKKGIVVGLILVVLIFILIRSRRRIGLALKVLLGKR